MKKRLSYTLKTEASGVDLKVGGANFWIGQADLRSVPERGSCGRGPEIGRSLSKLKSNKNKKTYHCILRSLDLPNIFFFQSRNSAFYNFFTKNFQSGGKRCTTLCLSATPTPLDTLRSIKESRWPWPSFKYAILPYARLS